jgi:hypothetical protein
VFTSHVDCLPRIRNVSGVGHTDKLFDSSGANAITRFIAGGIGAHALNRGFKQSVTIASDAISVRTLLGGVIELVPESSTSDNLSSITGGEEGDVILVKPLTGNVITLVQGSGANSISLRGSLNAVLTPSRMVELTYIGGAWVETWRSFEELFRVVGRSAVAVPHTGTTAETTLATIAIPANALGANGILRVTTLFSNNNSGGTKDLRIKFNGTTFWQAQTTTTLTNRGQAQIANRNATNSQVGGPNGTGGWASASGAVVTSAHDTTGALNVTITGQLSNGADTMTLESYVVEILQGA